MFSLLFSRRYSMAHRLRFCGSEKCALPHGHNEVVHVRLVAAPNVLDGHSNMVEPFAEAKRRWHAWIDDYVDHALQLAEDDPLLRYFEQNEPHRIRRIMTFPGDPTTEILAACFMAKLNTFLASDGNRLHCVEVRIEETPTNCVSFDEDADGILPVRRGENRWWWRPDMSINDLSMDEIREAAVA